MKGIKHWPWPSSAQMHLMFGLIIWLLFFIWRITSNPAHRTKKNLFNCQLISFFSLIPSKTHAIISSWSSRTRTEPWWVTVLSMKSYWQLLWSPLAPGVLACVYIMGSCRLYKPASPRYQVRFPFTWHRTIQLYPDHDKMQWDRNIGGLFVFKVWSILFQLA